jgi:hypothetical protein
MSLPDTFDKADAHQEIAYILWIPENLNQQPISSIVPSVSLLNLRRIGP